MKFSIIIPVYKVEKYLRRCIDSILKQTYTDFEAIFVIDGSPDNSSAICQEYISDPRIHIIEKENGGATSARKAGALSAKGEYIVCVDGDDYINEELLKKIDDSIKEHQSDMICYGYQTETSPDSKMNMLKAGTYINIDEIRNNYLHDFRYKDCNSGCLFYTLWTKAVKREIFVECQLKVDDHIKNGEDLLLVAWLLSKVRSISVIEYSGYVYCVNDESTTSKRVPYDLINVTNVVKELEATRCLPFENIYYYYFQAIFILTRDFARQTDKYSSFKNIIENNLTIEKPYINYKCHNPLQFSMKAKFSLVRLKMWWIIYYLANK